MPDRALALCRPPPPKWQRHWLGEIKMWRGKKTVSNVWLLPINNTKDSACISTSKGKMRKQQPSKRTSGFLMCHKITRLYQYFLLTCKQPPARACCYPEYVWAVLSLEASGTYPGAGWQPSGHSGWVSSKWWNAPGPSCQKDTERDGEWAQVGMGSYPACSLKTGIGTGGTFLPYSLFWELATFCFFTSSFFSPSYLRR